VFCLLTAYALTQNSLGNDYGAEAVNTLIKRMEDHRDDLALVVAGYTEPMKIFVESNRVCVHDSIVF
jgi:hypothetical protein